MNFRSLARSLLLLVLPFAAAAQTTIHVPADQPTIQAGINAANTGDTVLVAPGTYTENIDFKGKAITVTSSGGAAVTTISGGVQAATVLFQNNESRSSILSAITITGGGDGSAYGSEGGIYILHANPTITGNVISGAGCYGIGSVAGAPLIQNNAIRYTHVSVATGACGNANGSGIWIEGADNTQVPFPSSQGQSPQILHNTIEFNTESGTLNGDTLGGAGIAVRDGAIPLIEYNIIRSNSLNRGAMNGGSGGGILVFAAGATIVNNLIYGNTAVTGGGGVAVHNFGLFSFAVSLMNNTITDNATQPLNNGAITVGGEQLSFSGSHPVFLENNILFGAGSLPTMVCDEVPSVTNPSAPLPVSFVTNDVYNQGGPTTGGFNGSSCNYPVNTDGNISADPQFLNRVGSDYHLSLASPSVDTGAANSPVQAAAIGAAFSTDLDGNPRVVDATHKGVAITDMGAYEAFYLPASTTTMVCPTSASVGEISLVSIYTALSDGTKPDALIQMTDNGASISNIEMSAGAAGYNYIPNTPGTHILVASFPASPPFSGSSATCSIAVGGLPTRSVLSVSVATPTYGQPVTLSATVSPLSSPSATVPSGTVTFLSGTSALGTAALSSGVATLNTSGLPAGSGTLSCTYSGDILYAPSSCSPVALTTAPAATTLQLSSNANPGASPVAVTVRLSSNSTPPPSGLPVSLLVNPGGQALSLTTNGTGSATSSLAVQPGTYTLTATFAGTSNLLPSTASLTQVITGIPTTTTLTPGPNPAYAGQLVTLTATSTAAGAPDTTGTLTFHDGPTALGTATLSAAGQATFTTSTLSVGLHTLTASLGPNGNLLSSVSAPIQLTVLPSTFAITLNPATLTLQAGKAGAVTVNLASIGTFAGPLALSTGTLPTYASASFVPASITLTTGGTATASLRLNTAQDPGTSTATSAVPPLPPGQRWPLLASAALLLPLGFRRSRRLRQALAILVIAVACQALTGCGIVGYPFHLVAPGTYRIPITATAADNTQHTTILTLTITP